MRRVRWFLVAVMLVGCVAAKAQPTVTPTPPVQEVPVLLFDPDLNRDGEINSADLFAYLQAWQIREAITPTPTPAWASISGFVVSASDNGSLVGATVLAGTAVVESLPNGYFSLSQVDRKTTSLLAHCNGYQTLQRPIELIGTTLNVVLEMIPVGFPTPTHTATTPPTVATPTPTSVVSTPTNSPTPSRTPTVTATPTATATHTSTPTATPNYLLGDWSGKLNGDRYINTPITWTVIDGHNANARITNEDYPGTYTINAERVVNFQSSLGVRSLQLQMQWNGANSMTSGSYEISNQTISYDSGSFSLQKITSR